MKFVRSSAGPVQSTAYYRQKLAALGRKRAALEAAGTPDARRDLDIKVRPKIGYYELRLAAALRNELKAVGALACRGGTPVTACPIHPSLGEQDRLFCAWCEGWWDERFPPAKKRKK